VTDVEPTFTFLSVEDVLSLHEDAIDAWGGTHGIRDPRPGATTRGQTRSLKPHQAGRCGNSKKVPARSRGPRDHLVDA
jgi:hypothetical protein